MAFGIVLILGIVTANPILPWNESRYVFSNSLALGNCVQAGVAPLIDEMFLEVHAQLPGSSSRRKPLVSGKSKQSSFNLLQSLRAAGVYAHGWA